MRRLLAALSAMVLALSIVLGGTPRADAATEAAGYSDFSYSGVSAPTGEKPQSKLWFNDGRWWGSLFNRTAGTYHIYWLDVTTQGWVDTGVELDNRPNTQADCMWDAAAGKLYLVSGGSSNDARLYRYSYDVANKRYSRDTGFPVTIRSGGAETIVLDKDSIGRLWVTYTKSSQVYVNYSNGSDNSWAGPTPLNVSGTDSTVSSDDISSLITVNNRVIVLWSNQSDRTFYYAAHNDADPVTSWTGGVAGRDPNGGALADDHINIKSLQSDAAGNIFAVVKTSFNSSSSSSPQIILLVAKRQTSGNGYTWQPPAMVSSGAENQTRAILLIDTDQRNLHVFTADEGGGSIYHKQASIDNIQFPSGFGERFIGSLKYTDINNPSSTKQTINSSTGLVVIASDDTQDWYLHNYRSLGGTPPADTTPPTVSGTTPANNASGISTATSVTASFSEALDASTVNGTNFRLSGPSGAVAANVSYDSGTRTATLAPSAALAAGANYTAQISGVKDVAGNTLAGTYSWSFSTAATPQPGSTFSFTPVADTYVSQASPGSNYAGSNQMQAVGGSSAKQIFIRFDVSGLPAGASVSSAKLRLYVSNDSTSGGIIQSVSRNDWPEALTWALKPELDGPVRATLGSVALNATVEVDLSAAIAGNGSYSFAITLPNANTNTLAYATRENSTATSRPQLIVTTGGSAPADTTPPTITTTAPSNAASNVSTGTSVTATFSEPLDASTVNGTNFSLAGPTGTVPATVSYSSASNSATLAPSAALAAGASYTAQISGVKDVAGNTLAGTYSWSFSTAAAPPADTTAPTVTNTTPANGATNVGTSASVTATFSEPL
ncbi:MAG TPA: Ig-like domain-containing protein, partial [Roseiflexaceae bacterium]|nr:Ig-like domain-containing protein [Roseiflexaceae bacterium]